MPKQVIPFTGFDQVGVNLDNPPVSLPPNAFSDCRNVRFKDGAVRKMEGEVNMFPNLFDGVDDMMNAVSYDGSILKYVVWWPNPNLVPNNQGYYLIIREETWVRITDPSGAITFAPDSSTAAPGAEVMNVQRDIAYLILPGSTTLVRKGDFTRDENAAWQHTFFQGGFSLIINNGLDAPAYILDEPGNTDINAVPNFATLPGWQSYRVNSRTITDTYMPGDTRVFDLGTPINFNVERVQAIISNRGSEQVNLPITFNGIGRGDGSIDGSEYNVDQQSGQASISFGEMDLPDNAVVTINIESLNPVAVRAGVVRSFGDFLVAGNLVEIDEATIGMNNEAIVRNLAGVVRTSDVAAPGAIPLNWNPFASGVSTADEFILTATGVVQDMAELQGSFYIYSNNSISVMRQTGNPSVPLTVVPLTDTYGAQTTEGVVEFDGKHFVIGSQDIYLFGGHPGSIQSVADQRVRRYFFQNLNPLHNQRLFTLRYSQRDEIWICFPTTSSVQGECDQALIWNYRNNTWTIRELGSAVSGDVGPVPGGGLPTASNTFSGATGSFEAIQVGSVSTQAIEFPVRTLQIQNGHSGVPTTLNIETTGLQPFVSNASSFVLTFGDNFNSGPMQADPAIDQVNFRTAPVDVRFQLLQSSDTSADVTINLPRYLTTDKQWVATQTYFAGFGQAGDAGFYTGQRVIDTDAAGVSTVYRVTNGFGDGSVPGAFYRPDEDGPFYDNPESSTFVYQDTFDVVGVRPRDLVAGAVYGTTPGDGGTGNTLSAAEARWEVVGTADTEAWTAGDVARIFGDTLNANSTFTQFFRTIDNDPTDAGIIVEARNNSGEGGFPTYGGIAIEFGFPDLNNDPNAPDMDNNGGNITDFTLVSNADTTIDQSNAVILTFDVRRRTYTPFNENDPDGTGRYLSDPTSAVLDRVMVAFDGNFGGTTLNADVAMLVREAFRRDPQLFWTVTGTGTNTIITSNTNANYELDVSLQAPAEIGINTTNFVITTTTVGAQPIDGTVGALTPELPYFRVTPPQEGGAERPAAFFQPTGLMGTVTDRGTILENLMAAAVSTYANWSSSSADDGEVVTMTTTDDPDAVDIPARLRVADRPVTGTWRVDVVAPGNTINTGVFTPTPLGATSSVATTGAFALNTTPSYLGILVSNPTLPGGLEFLMLEDGDPLQVLASRAVQDWIAQIRAAIPRISLVTRASGFFLQPANYDSLANFVLDVRINNTPENAHWMYQIATTGVNPEDTTQNLIALNPASETIRVNGSEADDMYDRLSIPATTDPMYVRSGGPLKIAQFLEGNTSTPASLDLDSQVTLIFDIFRPWPRDEINNNLEYPILATALLAQDSTGIFHRLNKVIGADIGWSRPAYDFPARAVTEDRANFRETINANTADFPIDYESYYERVQLALLPEFDTEQLTSLALWADGSTPEFLRGRTMHNQLDLRITTTNNPGEATDFSTLTPPAAQSNMFNVSADYKADMRLHGRFINYRITDGTPLQTTTDINASHQAEWSVSGMQADIMKGGTR